MVPTRRPLHGWVRLAPLLGALALAGAARAETADDPFQMLEERREVTAASKRPQPLSETPSIVTVITAAEIRAHGYRTLGEVLQWVRGFYTRYDRNYTYVGVRGMQRPGDYNNKVLLTLDGHTVNTPIYGDAAFGPELGLDMESVERVEIVRGPGSALYGSNAVLAVVNVVTRPARAREPLETGGSVGSRGERRAYASLASARRDLPNVTLTGSWSDADGASAGSLGLPGTLPTAGARNPLDAEEAASLLGAVAWHGARLTAKLNERTKHVAIGAYGTRIGDPATRTRDAHDFVELSAVGQPADVVEIAARTWWDGSRYWGSYAFGPDTARVVNRDIGTSDQVGAELRMNWRPAPHHVATLGTEGRWVLRALQLNRDFDPLVTYTDVDRRWGLGSFYAQDEMQVGRARLAAGARLDGDTQRRAVLSPRFDLSVPVGDVTTWKVMAGTAYRAPVPYETDYFGQGQLAASSLEPERINSVETALQRRLGAAQVLLSAYANWTRDLIDVEVDSLGNFAFFNRGRVRGAGLEGEVEWSPWPGGSARGDFAWQESRDAATGLRLSNSPPWNAHFVLTQNPIHSSSRFGAGVRWLGPRTTLDGVTIPQYALVDARLSVLPRAAIELGVEVRNVFNAHYADPAAPEHPVSSIPQDPRSVSVTIALRRSPAP